MSERLARFEEASKVLADPDIQEVIRRKTEGKEFVIRDKEPEAPATNPLDELLGLGDDDDNDDDPSELTHDEMMRKVVGGVKEALGSAVADAVKPLQEELESMKKEKKDQELASQDEALQKEALQLKEEVTDLDDFTADMINLHSKGLTLKDYYLLAKAKKLGLPSKGTESERPFNFLSSRPSVSSTENPRKGRRGFEQILNDATTKRYGQ